MWDKRFCFLKKILTDHWKAIGRVFGYLKKTKNLGLYYSKFPAILEGYTNASWISSLGENKSTSG